MSDTFDHLMDALDREEEFFEDPDEDEEDDVPNFDEEDIPKSDPGIFGAQKRLGQNGQAPKTIIAGGVALTRRFGTTMQGAPLYVDQNGNYVDQNNNIQREAGERESAMSQDRTMYDEHFGAAGGIMICMMDDTHLRNTIRVIASKFIQAREAMTAMREARDPMIAAMMKNEGWNAERVVSETKTVLRNLSAYVMEATLRGGETAEEAQRQLRAITARSVAVERPNAPLMIEDEELP